MGATPTSTSTEASPRTPSARRVLLASTETPRVSASLRFYLVVLEIEVNGTVQHIQYF